MAKVYVKVQMGTRFVAPTFSQCLVDFFKPSKQDLKCDVSVNSDGDSVVLSSDLTVGTKATLQHSPVCPIREISDRAVPTEKKIAAAVSIILESSDHHILLTRRPSHMSVSPGSWVPPGGHLEPGETLLAGGLRELHEETGIQLIDTEVNATCIGLWESVYPLALGLGEPKSHILVVYYHVKSASTYRELNMQIKMDPKEVDSVTWLSEEVVGEIFQPVKTESHKLLQFAWREGKVVETELAYLSMFNRFIWTGSEIYSGVQLALTYWFESRRIQTSKM